MTPNFADTDGLPVTGRPCTYSMFLKETYVSQKSTRLWRRRLYRQSSS
jgi:hypothetical protein